MGKYEQFQKIKKEKLKRMNMLARLVSKMQLDQIRMQILVSKNKHIDYSTINSIPNFSKLKL